MGEIPRLLWRGMRPTAPGRQGSDTPRGNQPAGGGRPTGTGPTRSPVKAGTRVACAFQHELVATCRRIGAGSSADGTSDDGPFSPTRLSPSLVSSRRHFESHRCRLPGSLRVRVCLAGPPSPFAWAPAEGQRAVSRPWHCKRGPGDTPFCLSFL